MNIKELIVELKKCPEDMMVSLDVFGAGSKVALRTITIGREGHFQKVIRNSEESNRFPDQEQILCIIDERDIELNNVVPSTYSFSKTEDKE